MWGFLFGLFPIRLQGDAVTVLGCGRFEILPIKIRREIQVWVFDFDVVARAHAARDETTCMGQPPLFFQEGGTQKLCCRPRLEAIPQQHVIKFSSSFTRATAHRG